MAVSVTVLYPPPSLSASRVSLDLARYQHSLLASSLKWLKLQDQDAESCDNDFRFAPSAHVSPVRGPYTTPDEQHTHFTSSHRIIDPSGKTTWNPNTVSFDLSHSVAEIRRAPSTSNRHHPASFWLPESLSKEDCEESIMEYPEYEEHSARNVQQRHGVPASRKRKRHSPENLQQAIPEKSHAAATTRIAGAAGIHARDEQGVAHTGQRHNNSTSDRFNLNTGDEDSIPAPVPSRGITSKPGITSSWLKSDKSKSANPFGHQVGFQNAQQYLSREEPVAEQGTPSEAMLHDVTNFTYGGAVDSQSQQFANINTRGHGHNDTRHRLQEKELYIHHGQTEQETQFSLHNDSAPPATYQSMPLTIGTNQSRSHADECGEFDLPIIDVSSLVHLDDVIQDGTSDPRSGPTNNSVNLLAVIFEVGESKDIPVKTFAGGAGVQAHPNTNKLCSIKVCQPRRNGQDGIVMMEVTLWGKLAERTDSPKHRFVKGDVVWFKSA
ncbi:hypothetical protein QFC22_005687 [Naganishia vaughanmartiniae]|uniref:Uncharacterized protein n=1 Tax=Naganishia vaughanmartiniae TaxID=1424756 RepID=A0ACC2WR40_9TREE|nr:hypothetical protein QFC22_005687 [Naganishia vaughanmartiniae]